MSADPEGPVGKTTYQSRVRRGRSEILQAATEEAKPRLSHEVGVGDNRINKSQQDAAGGC